MAMKTFWDKTYEYKRIIEILDDYWLTEPYEDYVKVKMAFIKGGEFQTKYITWSRNPNPSKRKLKIEPVNLADIARIADSIETGLSKFVESKCKELQIDERKAWEEIEYFADMYFINRKLKSDKEDDEN